MSLSQVLFRNYFSFTKKRIGYKISFQVRKMWSDTKRIVYGCILRPKKTSFAVNSALRRKNVCQTDFQPQKTSLRSSFLLKRKKRTSFCSWTSENLFEVSSPWKRKQECVSSLFHFWKCSSKSALLGKRSKHASACFFNFENVS